MASTLGASDGTHQSWSTSLEVTTELDRAIDRQDQRRARVAASRTGRCRRRQNCCSRDLHDHRVGRDLLRARDLHEREHEDADHDQDRHHRPANLEPRRTVGLGRLVGVAAAFAEPHCGVQQPAADEHEDRETDPEQAEVEASYRVGVRALGSVWRRGVANAGAPRPGGRVSRAPLRRPKGGVDDETQSQAGGLYSAPAVVGCGVSSRG